MSSREEPILFEASGILVDSPESQMGVSFSMQSATNADDGCCSSQSEGSQQKRDAVVVRSISFKGKVDVKTVLRSVSFDGKQESEAIIMKSDGARKKMVVEGLVSFKKRDFGCCSSDTAMDDGCDGGEKDGSKHQKTEGISESTLGSPKHEAAVKLQKVYKSFRTRRNLADCAVLVNQLWWMALDFATLKLSSVSFFDIDKPETAVSRWSRARIRAAKVGKGLSKDENAQKLALQHWLEAIDPRHRYGHNLHFYYDIWLDCDSKQPFFYWLDIGDGKEINLEKCPRCKLQQQCIKYLGPKEREVYEVIVKEGKFVYKKSGKLLDTSEADDGAKWIFVLSTAKALYVGQKRKGRFQHSSFLAGGATSAAGRLVVLNGILKAVWPYSGHYRPTEENFQEFVLFLQENGVDISNVKRIQDDGDGDQISRAGSLARLGTVFSDSELCIKDSESEESENSSGSEFKKGTNEDQNNRFSVDVVPLTKRTSSVIIEQNGLAGSISPASDLSDDEIDSPRQPSPVGSPRQQSPFCKRNLFDQEDTSAEVESLPKECILQRINSRKGMLSYQLGKQLSCKWTTGAGPRIGFVRDHPSELQFRALEQVNLSPRSATNLRSVSSPRPS